MKKNYIAPLLFTLKSEPMQMIAASIRGVGGDAKINVSNGTAPDEADVKGNSFGETIFD